MRAAGAGSGSAAGACTGAGLSPPALSAESSASTRLSLAAREAVSPDSVPSQRVTRVSSAVVLAEGLSLSADTPAWAADMFRSSSSCVNMEAKRRSVSRSYMPESSPSAPLGAIESSSVSRMSPVRSLRTPAGSFPSRHSSENMDSALVTS